MKLGATITSERGKAVTKTGNEYLHIDIKNEYGDIVAKVAYTDSGISIMSTVYCESERVDRLIEKRNGNLKHG